MAIHDAIFSTFLYIWNFFIKNGFLNPIISSRSKKIGSLSNSSQSSTPARKSGVFKYLHLLLYMKKIPFLRNLLFQSGAAMEWSAFPSLSSLSG